MKRAVGAILFVTLVLSSPAQDAKSTNADAHRFLKAWKADPEGDLAPLVVDLRSELMLVADVLYEQWLREAEDDRADDLLGALVAFTKTAVSRRSDARGLDRVVSRWRAEGREFGAEVLALKSRCRKSIARLKEAQEPGEIRTVLEETFEAPLPEVFLVLVPWEAGEAARRLGSLALAEAAYVRAATAARELSWNRIEVKSLSYVGEMMTRQGEPWRSIATFERALELDKQLGAEFGAARMCMNLAMAHAAAGNIRRFRELHPEAVRQVSRFRDLPAIAVSHETFGNVAMSHGFSLEAAASYRSAYGSWMAEGLTAQAATAKRLEGLCLIDLGRYAEGLSALESAATEHHGALERGITTEWPDAAQVRAELANDHLALGHFHLEFGRREDAKRAFEEALAIASAGSNLVQLAQVRAALGTLELEFGRPAEAVRHLEPALKDLLKSRANVEAAGVAQDLARAMDGLGMRAEAVALLRRTIASAVEREDSGVQARAYRELAALQTGHGDFEEAAASAAAAVVAARRSESRLALAEALLAASVVAIRRGAFLEAIGLAEEVLDLRREFSLGLDEDRGFELASILRQAADLGFEALHSMKEDDRDPACAFGLIERARGTLLLERVVSPRVMSRSSLSEDLREDLAAARQTVANLQRRLLRTELTPAARKADEKALLAAAGEFETLLGNAERQQRRLAGSSLPSPVTLAELQRLLPKDTAFVAFHIAGKRACALAVTATSAQVTDLGDADRLTRRVEAWRALLTSRDAALRGDERIAAEGLHTLLFLPFEKLLDGSRRLIVSPDGPLSFVPLDALLAREGDQEMRLVERFEIVLTPSATIGLALARSSAETTGEGYVALADPLYPEDEPADRNTIAAYPAQRGFGDLVRLRASADEVAALDAAMPAELPAGRRRRLLRGEATFAGLARALDAPAFRHRVVHLACHGFLHPERPRLSGLVLAGGEVVNLNDICGLRVNADLAVLSACETALGALRDGEGVLGLARAFFFAGVPRVLVTEWKVEDQATATFMAAFYDRHLRQGLSASAALRSTRLAWLAKGGDDAHPSRWAAFVLWGAWN